MQSNLFFKYPIFLPSIFTSILYILLFSFYTSPKFNSESIISVSSGDQVSVSSALGFVNNLLGSGIDQSIGDLKAYLESDDAILDIKKVLDIEKIYSNSDIDFFSRYRPDSFGDLKSYLNNAISLKADTSGNLIITTSAFKPEDAYKVNLSLIMLSSNYFDRRQALSSKLSTQKYLCQFQLSKNGFPEIETNNLFEKDLSPIASKIDIDKFTSAHEMLMKKAEAYTELCNPSLLNQTSKATAIPEKTLRDLNNDTIKQIIGNIYSNSISAITMSDAIEILAEPTVSQKSERKHIILNTFLIFIFSILFFTTLRIIFKLRDDYRF